MTISQNDTNQSKYWTGRTLRGFKKLLGSMTNYKAKYFTCSANFLQLLVCDRKLIKYLTKNNKRILLSSKMKMKKMEINW